MIVNKVSKNYGPSIKAILWTFLSLRDFDDWVRKFLEAGSRGNVAGAHNFFWTIGPLPTLTVRYLNELVEVASRK